MKVKCNVTQCEFNKNNACANDKIEINFTDFEYEYAYCSNYKESLESIRSNYFIQKIDDKTICKEDYIIFSKDTNTTPMDCIAAIIEDLIQDGNNGCVRIISDELLSRGNTGDERYIKWAVNLNTKDFESDNNGNIFKFYDSPKNSKLRKYSAKYYSQYPKLIEHSILDSVQKKMILKGIGI